VLNAVAGRALWLEAGELMKIVAKTIDAPAIIPGAGSLTATQPILASVS